MPEALLLQVALLPRLISPLRQGIEAAQQICTESGSKSACYHLARHLEADGRAKEAIHFYSLSGRVGHALRLAQVTEGCLRSSVGERGSLV